MSDLYRDFIDQKADQIINSLGGTITPAPANAELYRDFLDRKFEDVINAIGGGGSSSHNYSTTEHVVGTWIDGTPVYEKTILLDNISGASYVSPALNLDINAVVDFFAYIQLGFEGAYQWVTTPIFENITYHIFCHYQSADDKIYIKSRWGVANAIVTIRYTKTTN